MARIGWVMILFSVGGVSDAAKTLRSSDKEILADFDNLPGGKADQYINSINCYGDPLLKLIPIRII